MDDKELKVKKKMDNVMEKILQKEHMCYKKDVDVDVQFVGKVHINFVFIDDTGVYAVTYRNHKEPEASFLQKPEIIAQAMHELFGDSVVCNYFQVSLKPFVQNFTELHKVYRLSEVKKVIHKNHTSKSVLYTEEEGKNLIAKLN